MRLPRPTRRDRALLAGVGRADLWDADGPTRLVALARDDVAAWLAERT